MHLPSACPPFFLQLRDPNPDRHPEAGAVQLNAQRGSSGRARSQESPWGWSSTKTAPSHPRLAEPGAAVLVWSWWHRGQRGLGRTGAPCRGRGQEEHSEAGSCPPAPCHTTTGGHRSQGGPWRVAASRGSLRGRGQWGWERVGPSCQLLVNLAPAGPGAACSHPQLWAAPVPGLGSSSQAPGPPSCQDTPSHGQCCALSLSPAFISGG